MKALANLVTRRAWWVLGIVALIVTAALANGVRPEPEDDILKFLPPGDPDIRMFRRISQQFGGLEVAMVGIETRDVFDPAFLRTLDQLTEDLRQTRGVDRVVSLTNLADFEPDKEKRGIKAGELVDVRQFSKPGYLKALRARVLGKEHVVGQFVDRAAKATLVLCFLVPDVNQKPVVERIQEVTRRHLPKETIYWGGAPFSSAYIFKTTERDIRVLTPFALAVIILIMLVSFRDPLGVVLSLLSTAVGAVVAFSLMVAFHVKLNLVLSSMPVILFAVGSAYGIHILSRYYRLAPTMDDRKEAVRQSLVAVGPAVLATGLTTMAGFVSFVVMDIPPMRLFGLFTALGIGASMLTALVVIPAVLSLTGRFRKLGKGDDAPKAQSWLSRRVGDLAAASIRRRRLTLIVASALAVVGIGFATRIKVEVEPSAFYDKGSPPDLADRFMGRSFGGAQFVQVHFDLAPMARAKRETADAFGPFFPWVRARLKPVIEDPLVLREVRRFAERMEADRDVSSVLHLGLPVSLGNEMADDLRRIPDTRAKVKNIYGLVSTDPTVNQLLSPSHRDLLVHIKVRSSRLDVINRVLSHTQDNVDHSFRHAILPVDLRKEKDAGLRKRARQVQLADTALHIVAVARRQRLAVPTDAEARVRAALAPMVGKPVQVTPAAKRGVAENLTGFLLSSEFPGAWPKRTPEDDPYDRKAVAAAIAAKLAALGPHSTEDARDAAVKAAAGKVLGGPKCMDFSTFGARELGHSWRLQRSVQLGLAAAHALGVAHPSPGVREALATAAMDLDAPVVGVPAHGAELASAHVIRIRPTVTGMPVVLRALARSVQKNQIYSLLVSLGIVFLIMVIMFRSLYAGVIAVLPAGLTLVGVFGGLSLVGKPLDISTSMVAGIAVGVGIDYAIHFLSWWQRPADGSWVTAARDAARESGGGILANAVMVCAGFAVLALGQSAPTKALGILIAVAMAIAALVTFLVVPAGAGPRTYYEREAPGAKATEAAQNAQAELAAAGPERSA